MVVEEQRKRPWKQPGDSAAVDSLNDALWPALHSTCLETRCVGCVCRSLGLRNAFGVSPPKECFAACRRNVSEWAVGHKEKSEWVGEG
jgi:hypothetical protein